MNYSRKSKNTSMLSWSQKIAKGKAILRKHEGNYSAQKAYAEFQEHHLKSTKASLSSVKILGYITSAKIGDGSWHGTAKNFILNWQNRFACMSGLPLLLGTSQMNRNLPYYRLLFIHFNNFAKSRPLSHFSRSILNRT
jgi:hypothetical protein